MRSGTRAPGLSDTIVSMAGLKDFLSLNQFNSRLQELHAKARGGSLDPAERAAYERCRSDLARMLVFAQQLTRRPSETFRQALRVPLAFKLDVETTAKHREQTVTIDVSTGGFAAILVQARVSGETLAFTLHLPDEALVGRAQVVASSPVAPDGKGFRMSFAIQDLQASDLERLEMATFDWVLAQLELGPPK